MALPAIYNIQAYQGDRYDLIIRVRTITAGVPGAYIDLTGKTPAAAVKADVADVAPLATFTCAILDQVVALGGCQITLTPAQTAALVAGDYVWDFQLKTSTTDIKTYLAGGFSLVAQVTRDV